MSTESELQALRARLAQAREQTRQIATVLMLSARLLGPDPNRATLVSHGLRGARRMCDALLAELGAA